MLTLVASILVLAAPAGQADTPEILLGRNRMGEFQGVRGDNFLAWQQNTKANPRHFDVYAQPVDGGGKFKVNAAGTNAANGGIDGDVLVYQEFRRGRSDLRFFDLGSRTRSNPPAGVNTNQWEYWPSISGDHLLFGRLAGNGTRRVILYDLGSETAQVLDKIRGRRTFIQPGQVNGDWATWSKCRVRQPCEVFRFNIANGNEQRIPNPGSDQYAPSVAPDGTVYFARARRGCGNGVRLFSFSSGDATQVWRLPSGDDVGTTRVYVNDQDRVTLLFDQFDCDRAWGSDVWRIANPDAPTSPSPSPSPTPAPGAPQCDDGIDNDNDGHTDHPDDPGCDNPSDNNEGNDPPPPPPQCSDGDDNDMDGDVDLADAGCTDANDNDESDDPPPPPPPQCSNLIDDDGDLLIDFPADPGCDDVNDDDELPVNVP